MLTARDIMTPEVITIAPEAKVEDLAKLLAEHRISGVPVLDQEGKIGGGGHPV
jgi:CBS domain-containing protein